MATIFASVDLPNDAGRVVVFEWQMAPGPEENLVCFEPDGRIRWRAKLPTTDPYDCFVGVRLDKHLIVATSMSCYVVRIDPATGMILSTRFSK
jgi:sugar lactone lactonase YvrE